MLLIMRFIGCWVFESKIRREVDNLFAPRNKLGHNLHGNLVWKRGKYNFRVITNFIRGQGLTHQIHRTCHRGKNLVKLYTGILAGRQDGQLDVGMTAKNPHKLCPGITGCTYYTYPCHNVPHFLLMIIVSDPYSLRPGGIEDLK